GLVQFGIHQHPQDQATGFLRHIDDAESVRQVRKVGKKFVKQAAGSAQEIFLECCLMIVRIERQVANRSFHQVLKKMGAEREIRQVVSSLPRDFDQHGTVVDVGVSDRNAEFDVSAATPASRTDQDKLPLRQQLVQSAYRAPDIAHCGLVGKLAVALQVHINNVRDLRHLPIRDEAVCGEDHFVRRQILRDRSRHGVTTIALRPALQEIKVLTVVGKLDVHRRAQLGLQKIQQLADPSHEGRLPDQAFEAENNIACAKVWDWAD